MQYPRRADEQKLQVFKKCRFLSFQLVADKLKYPGYHKQTELNIQIHLRTDLFIQQGIYQQHGAADQQKTDKQGNGKPEIKSKRQHIKYGGGINPGFGFQTEWNAPQ